MAPKLTVNRRDFVVAASLTGCGMLLTVARPQPRDPGKRPRRLAFEPNVWLRIDADEFVTIQVAKSELGQGVWTALPMIVAEELDADWTKVRVERAPVDRRFGDPNTGGSGSVRNSWLPLRRAGATARAMLLTAAARTWGVPDTECRTTKGSVVHDSTRRSLSYGSLAAAAAAVPVPDPQQIQLKNPRDFTIIGKPTRRLDTPAKVSGTAKFGIDVRVPGMLYASVERCPTLSGRIVRVDSRRAERVPGVRKVVTLEPFADERVPWRVAVVADNTWAALQGRRALEIEWDLGPDAAFSSADLAARCRQALEGPAAVVSKDGNPDQVAPGRRVEAIYEAPLLAHATMEPMNGTAHVRADDVEVWAPTQYPNLALGAIARLTKLQPDRVRINVTLSGGGFGRRINVDFLVEAVQISQQVGAPVKVTWTREDDIRHDFYRPLSVQRLRGTLGDDGLPLVWERRVAGPSTAAFYNAGAREPHVQEMWGTGIPYRVPNKLLEFAHVPTPQVPLGWWRAVGNSQNVFCAEAFIDELAAAVQVDPLEYRRRLLADQPALLRVLELTAERAGWDRPLPRGAGRGLACMNYGGTLVAQVAEVSVRDGGRVAVTRVVCGFDCGQMINPDTVRAQIEGSIIWTLGAVLHQAITIDGGRVRESNFHDFPVARLPESPAIEIHLVESQRDPTGVGEPAVPAVAAAIVNAVYAATGTRVRRLPIRLAQAPA